MATNIEQAVILNNLGCECAVKLKLDLALDYFLQAIKLDDKYSDAYSNIAGCYFKKNYTKAIYYYNQALKYIDNKGYDIKALKHIDINGYNNSNSNNKKANILNNLSTLYYNLGDYDNAEAYLQQALALKPDFRTAKLNLGLVYKAKGLFKQAYQIFASAKDDCQFLFELGNLLLASNEVESLKLAITYYNQALQIIRQTPQIALVVSITPTSVVKQQYIYINLSLAYKKLGEIDKLISTLDELLAIDADNPYALSNKLFYKLKLANWNNLEQEKNLLLNTIEKFDQGITLSNSLDIEPFAIQVLDLPLATIMQVTKQHAKKFSNTVECYDKFKYENRSNNSNKVATNYDNDKITIGYISCDFNNHPIGLLFRTNFKYHDRQKFNCYCYYLNHKYDQYTEQIKTSADKFVDLSNLNAYQAAQVINNDKVDILIDLSGFTGDAQPEILALQPAPIQCHFAATMHSMMADYIQYHISHPDIVAEDLAEKYSEKIMYLPKIICATEKFTDLSPLVPLDKADFNLPSNAFIYCCFSQIFRICPEIFTTWLDILQATSNSILWLQSSNLRVQENLWQLAAAKGVDRNRLIFLPQQFLTNNWPQQLADLWLEPKVFSSGTTSMLNIWANLPMLTLPSASPQTRLSAHILRANNLPQQLVANSLVDYYQKAVYYYNNYDKLQQIKQRLTIVKAQSPCFNPEKFIKDLELTFLQIYQTHACD